MKFRKYLNESSKTNNDDSEAKEFINDFYLTINLKERELQNIFHKFIYSLPEKYSTKKETLERIRKEWPKANVKDLKEYIDGFDESRLEGFVVKIYKVIEDEGVAI